MSWYPPGAKYDPKAPYNQKDPDVIECEECDGKGIVADSDEMCEVPCEECDGNGTIEFEDDGEL